MRVLMVCLGNICRSPTAAACVRQAARDAGVDVDVDSCGTGGWHEGEPADPRTVAHAARRGLDLSRHRARALRDGDFAAFDRLYVMDARNLRDVLARCPQEHHHKVSLFLDDDAEVPDPYHGGPAGFDHVLDLCAARAATLVAAFKAKP
jgi:protein-tyrosine phosphatase